ncbi:hypothetical protein HDU83_001758 [Entophlyctis luteolus]|nr:hypothetical protein HDU82_007528 [Entophlyctis luteolus]KAJ3356179.1 hypothetical protein HDU83_001758 [Entophlyctis luteolus]
MTASEPLTLEEEHAMQQSWALDESKLTFIVLSHVVDGTENGSPDTERHLGGMVGDANLYFTDFDDPRGRPEIEVMIAESGARRKGIGYEAVRLIMQYAVQNIPSIHTFVAKISLKNEASLSLFRDKLGFSQRSISEVFGEVTMEKQLNTSDVSEWTALKIERYSEQIN